MDSRACDCEPSTEEVKAGISGVTGYPEIHSEFKANLGYMRLHLKITTQTRPPQNQSIGKHPWLSDQSPSSPLARSSGL